MICPLCNTEMRIKATDYVMNDGKLFIKQTFTCRNKTCSNHGKDVKSIYTPLVVSQDNEAQQVTSTRKGAFFIPKFAWEKRKNPKRKELNMKKFENGLIYNLQFFAEEGDTSEGVNETESAEQSVDEGEVTETETEGVTEETAEPQPQSPETNAAFASMRRQNQELTRRLQETDAMFARQFGQYKNPETGQPIRSAKDR